MHRLLLLAALMLLPAAAPPPAVPLYRQFGRWLVTCDNTRARVSRGFDEVTRAQLDLVRPAGATRPKFILSAADPFDVPVPAAPRMRSPAFDPCGVHEPPTVFALDAGTALAIRPCFMAAYQGSSVVAVLPRRGRPARPVKLPLPGVPHDATDGPDMVDPGFDPATGILSTASKGRGLADCGSSESRVWSGGAFRLKELSFQDQCGGTEPGDWPTLFRTR